VLVAWADLVARAVSETAAVVAWAGAAGALTSVESPLVGFSVWMSADHVAGPTMPSTARPWAAWKLRIAAPVWGPITPSAVTPRRRCTVATDPVRTAPSADAWWDTAAREEAAEFSRVANSVVEEDVAWPAGAVVWVAGAVVWPAGAVVWLAVVVWPAGAVV
jgi:hypothetical protein